MWLVMLDWRCTLQAERKDVEASIQEAARQNCEQEELSKSPEEEKLLVAMQRNLSEVALKDLERDWVETGAPHETQRELEARLRKAQKERAGRSWESSPEPLPRSGRGPRGKRSRITPTSTGSSTVEKGLM